MVALPKAPLLSHVYGDSQLQNPLTDGLPQQRKEVLSNDYCSYHYFKFQFCLLLKQVIRSRGSEKLSRVQNSRGLG